MSVEQLGHSWLVCRVGIAQSVAYGTEELRSNPVAGHCIVSFYLRPRPSLTNNYKTAVGLKHPQFFLHNFQMNYNKIEMVWHIKKLNSAVHRDKSLSRGGRLEPAAGTQEFTCQVVVYRVYKSRL